MLLYWSPFNQSEPLRLTQDMQKQMTLQQLLVRASASCGRFL